MKKFAISRGEFWPFWEILLDQNSPKIANLMGGGLKIAKIAKNFPHSLSLTNFSKSEAAVFLSLSALSDSHQMVGECLGGSLTVCSLGSHVFFHGFQEFFATFEKKEKLETKNGTI